MRSIGRQRWSVVVLGWLVVSAWWWTHPTVADERLECLDILFAGMLQGLVLAPVPLNTEGNSFRLGGLGSYIVNAQGARNDCHTTPPYMPGGDPLEEPEPVNAVGYRAGGMAFGPFVSRNLTPCADGNPAGLTVEEFVQVMWTGVDLKDGQSGPPGAPILQVMP